MYSIGLNSYGSLNNDENGTSKASYNSKDARLQIGISEEEQQRLITANDDSLDVPNVHEQMAEIWETIKLKAVWKPMAFVYIFNILQVPNVAWQSFLQLSLHFEPWMLGLSVILGSLMTFVGILAYKHFFFDASWRSIYIWSTILTAFFSFLQLALIFQLNQYLYISDYFFSLGDDVITQYISGIQFLPVCILYMSLCPEGVEGASYAMLTTFGNIALVCANNIGIFLAENVWDVSNHAMRSIDLNGLWKLNLFTSVVSLLPLSLLYLLPEDQKEQKELAASSEKSYIGGVIFLIVLFGSIVVSIFVAIQTAF